MEIGKQIAQQALGKGIKKVVFDRGGYLYHGRIKALADAAREAGLAISWKSANRLPSRPWEKALRKWFSTAAGTSTTDASKRWPTRRAKQVWSSNGDSNQQQEEIRCRQLPA